MMKRLRLLSSIAIAIFAVSSVASAFTCFLTVAKDTCWTDYELTLKATNAATNEPIVTIVVPKGKSWAREKFTCQPEDSLHYVATYSPVFWGAMKDKIYSAKSIVGLPATIQTGQTAWDISTCFPRDFAEVPFPPEAEGNCQCNMKAIPAVKPPEKP
jgi:hypothetical protein